MRRRHRHYSDRSSYMKDYLIPFSSLFSLVTSCKTEVKAFLIFLFTLCILLWLAFPRNVCGGEDIVKKLCNEYYKRNINGDICFSLCHEQLFQLRHCIDDNPFMKTFLIPDNLVVRVPVLTSQQENDMRLPEGITIEQFKYQCQVYLDSILGHSDHHSLIQRILKFADFNGNSQLSLGEVQSVWSLINNQEFLFLFLFHKQSAIPNINGTCGNLYRYDHHPKKILYQHDRSGFLTSIFRSSYRWGFPNLHNRIQIAVGLLELVSDLLEVEGIPFFLCNIKSNVFGYTDQYELILNDLKELKSIQMLQDILRNRTCERDVDCQYTNQCGSYCDKIVYKCSNKIIKSPLYYVCDIIHEYLLVGQTGHFYYDLKHYLDKCVRLSPEMLEYSAFINEFHSFLWDFIKNDDKGSLVNFLYEISKF